MTRVLVVDDSVAVRGMISALLGDDPEIEVCGVAANGRLALRKMAELQPDAVTLDVEMPEMNGLETLKEIKRQYPKAVVIMVSSLTTRGAMATFDALAAGAADYVAKPEGPGASDLLRELGAELIAKIKLHTAPKAPAAAKLRTTIPAVQRAAARLDVVAIASSTGGPNALAAVIGKLPKDLRVPVVVVQHMPPLFTQLLAERLDGISPIHVAEGQDGAAVEPETVYIAPGGHHMEIFREGSEVKLHTHDGAPENSCRPAADVLFRSTARCYGGAVLGVVLTGMGQDGTRGSEAIRAAGGHVIAQDEASSVVWGMPRAVAEAGLADAILPLDGIAEEITRRVGRHA